MINNVNYYELSYRNIYKENFKKCEKLLKNDNIIYNINGNDNHYHYHLSRLLTSHHTYLARRMTNEIYI